MDEKERITFGRGPCGSRNTCASQRPRLSSATLLHAPWPTDLCVLGHGPYDFLLLIVSVSLGHLQTNNRDKTSLSWF